MNVDTSQAALSALSFQGLVAAKLLQVGLLGW